MIIKSLTFKKLEYVPTILPELDIVDFNPKQNFIDHQSDLNLIKINQKLVTSDDSNSINSNNKLKIASDLDIIDFNPKENFNNSLNLKNPQKIRFKKLMQNIHKKKNYKPIYLPEIIINKENLF